MRTDSEFSAFYTAVLEKKLPSLENLRRSSLASYKQVCYLLILPYILLQILLIVLLFTYISVLVIALALLAMFIIPWLYSKIQTISDSYKLAFRKQLIEEMIHFHAPTLMYDPEKGIMETAVDISNIFPYTMAKFESHDYVEGKIGQTFIQFSDISMTEASGGNENRTLFSFEGFFLIAQFNKYFKGECLVQPNETGAIDADAVHLENPEFQRAFCVSGDNEIEVRYLITPLMMSRMLDFKYKVKEYVGFSFTHNRFFIAIGGQRGLFDLSLFKTPDFTMIRAWNQSLILALGIVDDFNLNMHIWSKA
jgi:hypothetical protein